jgi:hypothetical protein
MSFESASIAVNVHRSPTPSAPAHFDGQIALFRMTERPNLVTLNPLTLAPMNRVVHIGITGIANIG